MILYLGIKKNKKHILLKKKTIYTEIYAYKLETKRSKELVLLISFLFQEHIGNKVLCVCVCERIHLKFFPI